METHRFSVAGGACALLRRQQPPLLLHAAVRGRRHLPDPVEPQDHDDAAVERRAAAEALQPEPVGSVCAAHRGRHVGAGPERRRRRVRVCVCA